MTDKQCRRCNTTHVQQGVHFDITDAVTGKRVMSYDICQWCIVERSPLILPSPVAGERITYSVAYESFDLRAQTTLWAGQEGDDDHA